MQRDAGNGRRAYVLPEQRTQERPPVVDILAGPAPTSDVVTVAEQEAWFETWQQQSAQPVPDGATATSGGPAVARPSPALVETARSQPDGWVYEIVGGYGADDAVPPEAVRGAWKVGPDGRIVGDFLENPNFRAPERPEDTPAAPQAD